MIKIKFWNRDTHRMTKPMTLQQIADSDILSKDVRPLRWTEVGNYFEGDVVRSNHFETEGGQKHYLYHRISWCYRLTGWQATSINHRGDEHSANPQLWVYLKNATDPKIVGSVFHSKWE